MIYEEYEAIWSKIHKLEEELFKKINKREELFEKTQPKTTQFDKVMVDGKKPSNMMEQYVIQKEYLNERINQLNTIYYEESYINHNYAIGDNAHQCARVFTNKWSL